MRGLWKLMWVEAKLFSREPMLGFFTLVFPLMMLFCFGGIYGNEPNDYFGGLGMVDVSVAGWTALVIATSAFMSLAVSAAAYREQGILRRLRLTPLSPLAVLAAQVAVLFVMTGLGMLLLIIAAKLVYGLRFDGSALSVAGAFALGALSMFSLGFVVAGLAPTARVAQVVGMVLFFPMIFLSGATIPLQAMQGAIRNYVKILPLTHVVGLLRGAWLGESWGQHLTEVAVLSGLLVVGVLISLKTFRWE
jgi:ABC-2 type transport system permease protein